MYKVVRRGGFTYQYFELHLGGEFFCKIAEIWGDITLRELSKISINDAYWDIIMPALRASYNSEEDVLMSAYYNKSELEKDAPMTLRIDTCESIFNQHTEMLNAQIDPFYGLSDGYNIVEIEPEKQIALIVRGARGGEFGCVVLAFQDDKTVPIGGVFEHDDRFSFASRRSIAYGVDGSATTIKDAVHALFSAYKTIER